VKELVILNGKGAENDYRQSCPPSPRYANFHDGECCCIWSWPSRGFNDADARSTPVFLDTGPCYQQLRRISAFVMVYRADDDAALHSVTTTALAERFARKPVGRLARLRCLFISADGWWLYRPECQFL